MPSKSHPSAQGFAVYTDSKRGVVKRTHHLFEELISAAVPPWKLSLTP